MRTVLCYGDSNTWGSIPMTHLEDRRRFGIGERWPGILRQQLGDDWHVVEEGLPGRTICRDDPVEGSDRNGLTYLLPCLHSHRPLDFVVLKLGTNDLKARFGASAAQIADGLHALVEIVNANSRLDGKPPRLLIVCPAPILDVGPLRAMFFGGSLKSRQFGALYGAVASQHDALFLDAGAVISSSSIDGIHLEKDAHAIIGGEVAKIVRGAC